MEIADSTKNILGYDCVMATAHYHGRDWTAWFTPDIPLPEGPWKLTGLPGLILEASESTDNTASQPPVWNPPTKKSYRSIHSGNMTK